MLNSKYQISNQLATEGLLPSEGGKNLSKGGASMPLECAQPSNK